MKHIVLLGSAVLALVALVLLVTGRRGSPEIAVERDLVYGKGGNADLKLCACCGAKLGLDIVDGTLRSSSGLIHFGVPAHHWWDDIVFT